MYEENYMIILSDSESLAVHRRDRKLLEKLIVNFADCLEADGRFKVGGTRYFWVDTLKPGTVKKVDEHETWYYYDGLYRMKAYGGYECGGRGCFYIETPTQG